MERLDRGKLMGIVQSMARVNGYAKGERDLPVESIEDANRYGEAVRIFTLHAINFLSNPAVAEVIFTASTPFMANDTTPVTVVPLSSGEKHWGGAQIGVVLIKRDGAVELNLIADATEENTKDYTYDFNNNEDPIKLVVEDLSLHNPASPWTRATAEPGVAYRKLSGNDFVPHAGSAFPRGVLFDNFIEGLSEILGNVEFNSLIMQGGVEDADGLASKASALQQVAKFLNDAFGVPESE